MKQTPDQYVEDMIGRYIYQVTKHLTANRKDIENELRTLIDDMLETRTQGSTVTKEDIDAVLSELWDPSEMADKYRSINQFLIGPELFPRYLLLLKIVLGATLFGMCFVTVLDFVANSGSNWYLFIVELIGNAVSGLLSAFGSVTLIFAILEWRGIKLKELTEPWKVSSLPPVPVKKANIPIAEPIVGIIFTIIFMLLLIMAPQVLGAFITINGSMTSIPVFNLKELPVVLPLFLIVLGIGLLQNFWALVERKYTLRYGIFTTIINTINILLVIIIFTRFEVWNPVFAEQVNRIYGLEDIPMAVVWDAVTSHFVTFLVLIYLLDTGTTLYKSIKYGLGNQ